MRLYCKDSESFYKVAPNGKIRFIKMPEDRSFLVGQLSQDQTLVVLFKAKDHRNMAVPAEVYNGLPNVKKWVVKALDTGRLMAASTRILESFGFIPHGNRSGEQQYLVSDRSVWSEIFSIGEDYAEARWA